MDSGIFKLDWTNVWSALVYGLIIGLGATVVYAISVGDLWALDWKIMVNTGVFAFLGSILKNLFTTDSGKFLGIVKVIPTVK